MRAIYLPRHVALALVVVGERPALGRLMPLRARRRWLELAAKGLPLPPGTVVRPVDLGERPAERVTVGATERPRAILYLHGGAYTAGSPKTHRSLAAFLAAASESVVYTLDYRLAAEHPYPAGLEDAIEAFRVLTREYPQERIAIAGDSAGGGLSVSTARRLVDDGLRPAALGLIAPWVDPPAGPTGKQRDLIISAAHGRMSAAAYSAGSDPFDPGIAPLRGDVSGLPPTLVHIGRTEVLYPQVMRFAEALRNAGVDVSVTEFRWLWHVGHAQAGILREALRAVNELGEFLRKHTDK